MLNTSALSRASQAGRTLIELLIAMAIGLVIVIGVSALYLSSSGISRTANQISTAEQAGQLALLLIGDSMKRAAYGEIIGSDYAGARADADGWRPPGRLFGEHVHGSISGVCLATGSHKRLLTLVARSPQEEIPFTFAFRLRPSSRKCCQPMPRASRCLTAVQAS